MPVSHIRVPVWVFWFTPKWLNSWRWIKLKPRKGNSILISHVGGKDSHTWAIICCLPRCTKLDRKQSNTDLNRHLAVECGHPRWECNLMCHNTHPFIYSLDFFERQSDGGAEWGHEWMNESESPLSVPHSPNGYHIQVCTCLKPRGRKELHQGLPHVWQRP